MSNKTSDKNVANIEDDVKIVKEFIDYAQGVIDDMEYERPVDVTVYQKDLIEQQTGAKIDFKILPIEGEK